ncbi:uncharacterized protein LOC127700734 [Mytilus californianus]|uniref:uncharacterized protein LOC127700734 n=1 Tax=Mytilus californianus TaxID=6549 RepID=UPI0022480D10|nr:uncharacterized protein LOC127700734 [Mytilus californianus]
MDMDEDEEENSLVTGIVCNGQKTKNSKISFIWGSPLHRMTDVHETDPYDTVDLDHTNSKSASYNQTTKFTSNQINSEESQYHSDTDNSQNTFALFGYDNLGDIDNSDEETCETSQDKHSNYLFQMKTQKYQEEHNWSLEKVKVTRTNVHPGASEKMEEDKKENNASEMISCDETSRNHVNQRINDKTGTCEENLILDGEYNCDMTSTKTATFKERTNFEEINQKATNSRENMYTATLSGNEEPQSNQSSITFIKGEGEGEMISENENWIENDDIEKSSHENESHINKNKMETLVLETPIKSEDETEISHDITKQTLENIDESYHQQETECNDASTRASSEDREMEAPNAKQMVQYQKEMSHDVVEVNPFRPINEPDLYSAKTEDSLLALDNKEYIANNHEHRQYANSFEISYQTTEHDSTGVEFLSASNENPGNKLQHPLNENANESQTENKMYVNEEELESSNEEPFNQREHDIKSELSIDFSAKTKEDSSPSVGKHNPIFNKAFTPTISEKEKLTDNYFTRDTAGKFSQSKGKDDISRKGNNVFHCNIKSSESGKQSSFQEHIHSSKKSKGPEVKKEFDNSVNFMKDLCLIGSRHLKKIKSQQNDGENISRASQSNFFPSMENRLTDIESELVNVISRDRNDILNDEESTEDKQSTKLSYNNANVDRFSLADRYETSETTTETERCNESEENHSKYAFTITHFGNTDELNGGQRRCISIKFDNYGESKSTNAFERNQNITFKYKTQDPEIELSSSQYKDAVTTKSFPKHTENDQKLPKFTDRENSFEMQANQPWSIEPNQSWSQDRHDLRNAKYNSTPQYHQSSMSDPFIRTDFLENETSYPNGNSETHDQRDEQLHSPQHNQLERFQLNSSSNPVSNKPLESENRSHSRRSWYATDHSPEGDCHCCKCTVKQHLSLLTEYMEKMGYDVKNVSGDGNCLFTAIVDQLRINGDFSYTHDNLRKRAVQFLRQRPHVDEETHLESFLTNETWEEYLAKMEMDGQWGDDIMLKGISELTGRKIVVYSSFMSRTEVTPTNLFEKNELFIGHIQNLMHFVSLRPQFWEMMWPMRALLRHKDQIISDLNFKFHLDSAIAVSSHEEAMKKIAKMRESLSTGDIDTFQKVQEEIDALQIHSTSVSKGMDELFKETPETMDTLVKQKFEIDKLSSVPMVHLTYLLKLLLPSKYFRNIYERLDSIFDAHPEILTRIGSGSMGLNRSLMDFTAVMQHYELLEKRTPKETEPLSVTFVIKLPTQMYSILNDNEERGISFERNLILDDTETLPGYTRLRPTNTAYWSGCIEWLSCQNAFLRRLKLKDARPPKIIEEFPEVSFKYFDGLDCDIWPKPAQYWTKRKPVSCWPSAEKIKEASEKGCILIKRAHEFSDYPDIEWQFIFTGAETVLVESFTSSMMYCFRVFKALVEHQTRTLKVKLKTYGLLTSMFYSSELIPEDAWSSNPGGCIMFIIAWLLQRVAERIIPNYFIPENNMIEHMEDYDLRSIEYCLQALRWFPFPSLYFLLERHSLPNFSMIDQIESSIEDYTKSKDKHKLVETVFIPLCFTLATANIRQKVLPFYNQALDYLEVGFELTEGVTDEEHSTTFNDFILSFLTSVKNSEVMLPFAHLVDKVKKTNLSQIMLKDKSAMPISGILGSEYTGQWGHVYVDVSEDKFNSIYELTGDLFKNQESEECAEILRCSISVLQRDLQDDETDYSEITDENRMQQLKKARYKQVYVTLWYLVTFYKHLSKCYEAMNKLELFQEHIYDYEEIVCRIDSRIHYENVANIYRQLGNREKANELEDKVKSMKNTEEPRGSRFLIIIP